MQRVTTYREDWPTRKRVPKTGIRPSFKRWTYEKLLPMVREYVIKGDGYVCVELASAHLKAKPALVHRCLAALNQEGLLTKPVNRAPHDSPRNPIFSGGYSSWMASWYRLTAKGKRLHEKGVFDALHRRDVESKK